MTGFAKNVPKNLGNKIQNSISTNQFEKGRNPRRILVEFIGKVYLDWPVVGWGFVLFWVSFMRCPLVRTILSLLHPTTC